MELYCIVSLLLPENTRYLAAPQANRWGGVGTNLHGIVYTYGYHVSFILCEGGVMVLTLPFLYWNMLT